MKQEISINKDCFEDDNEDPNTKYCFCRKQENIDDTAVIERVKSNGTIILVSE